MKRILVFLIICNTALAGDFERMGLRSYFSGVDSVRKSPLIATALSFVLPGLGQLYIKRTDVARYFFVSEALFVLTAVGLASYSKWINESAINFAVIHAGVDKNGKDDTFFGNIENYLNVYRYNEAVLRNRDYGAIYDTEKFFWWWDSESSRRRYRSMRIKSRELKSYANIAVAFIIANHFVSAVNANILARRGSVSLSFNRGVTLAFKFYF